MKLKLSPLWLFLLLLIVLIISAIFIKPLANIAKESFSSFYGSTNPNTTGLKIPTYDNTVDKLYDNDFFDSKTGNVLRVYATAYDPKQGQDTTGATIDHIDLIDRTGHTTTYANSEPIIINGLTSVPYNYTAWSAFSTNDNSTYVTSNQLIYCCWGQDTYIHIIDFTNNLNACGYYYTPSLPSPIYTNFNMSMPRLQVTKRDNNIKNNTYIFNDIVNMTLYQFTSNIFYSPLTGDMMVVDGKGNYLLYNRFGNSIPKFTDTGIDISTKPWLEYDMLENYMFIYVPYNTNTLIVILKLNTDGSTFSVIIASRFLADGSLQKDANTNIKIPPEALASNQPNSTTPINTPTSTKITGSTPIMVGYNGNNMIFETDPNFSMRQMNDYLLKTQIIPPICPVCPVCPSIGTCTNCKAPAAAPSTNDSHRAWLSPSGFTPSGFYQDIKDMGSGFKDFVEDTGKGAKDFIEDTASGATNLAKETASGATNLAKETASGATNLAKETVGGAVDLAKETASGATNLAKETVSGAVDLARETAGGTVGLVKEAGKGTVDILRGAGSEISSLFKEDGEHGENILTPSASAPISVPVSTPASIYNDNIGISGAPVGYYAQGIKGPQNPFTYNGALTEKPSSDFIPITSDFSKFGR